MKHLDVTLPVQHNAHVYAWARAGVPEFCRIPQEERNASWVGRPLTRTDGHSEEEWQRRQQQLIDARAEEDRLKTEKRLTRLKGAPVTVAVKKKPLTAEQLAAERAKYDKK